MLVLVLNGKTIAQNLGLIRENTQYVDGFELRADFLNPEERNGVKTIPSHANKPVILTYRLPADGGFFMDSEKERQDLYEDALSGSELAFAYADLEEGAGTEAVLLEAKTRGTKIIRSAHFFGTFPENPLKIFEKLKKRSGEIPKMALFIHDCSDMLRYLELDRKLEGQQRILPAMGEAGIPLRILSGRLGQWLCYSSPNGTAAAPGHLDPKVLQELYHFSSISPATKVFGIAGNPVSHSQSPMIHNAAYRQQGLDCVYLPFLVDNLKNWFQCAAYLKMSGASVTIPYKEKIIPFLTESDESVKACGSCNTLVFSENGIKGYNTDSGGFYKPLKEYVFAQKKALVIGAGGAARGICHALKQGGFEVLIVNRTAEKAKKLAQEFGLQWAALDEMERIKKWTNLIVQTTSCGMLGMEEKDPFPAYQFSGKEVVYDVIYIPEITDFLKRAKKAGCRVIGGKKMLLGQAELQYELFTGSAVSL